MQADDLANYTRSAHDEFVAMLAEKGDAYMKECLVFSTNCHACITAPTSQPCGWCPFSSTCVPDPSRLGILAAIRDSNICPYTDERFEFRARGLGCSVSSITLWSTVVSFTIGIIAVILVSALVLWLAKHRLLAWLERTLADEREKNLDREKAALLNSRSRDRGYQSMAIVSRIPSETYNADDEEEDEDEQQDDVENDEDLYQQPHLTTAVAIPTQPDFQSSGFIYNPQTQHFNSSKPRVYEIPTVEARRMSRDNDKFRMPEDEENAVEDVGLFNRLSSSVKDFVSAASP
ncbi:hypothetical protein BZA70DRAFT_74848 [Myxozyma melibiosi]|uniref:PSI domain-containing protein n=1 Tax=Myxozyma melibiosi TaxID=54550 RepID=A0ABR1F0B1_9ASCO